MSLSKIVKIAEGGNNTDTQVSGGIIYNNGSSNKSESELYYDETNKAVSINSTETSLSVEGATVYSAYNSHSEGTGLRSDFSAHRHSDTAARGATTYGARSRGTEASESAVQSGDNLLDTAALGHDGTNYRQATRIDHEVDGAVSTGVVPGRIVYKTADSSGNLQEALRMDSNQRVTPAKTVTTLAVSTASSATPTPNSDITDQYNVTALAVGATFGAPTGTPNDGQGLVIRIKDNGTAQTLAFNAIYRFSTDLAAPNTTILGKTLYLGFKYNTADTKWDCLAILNNF